MAKNPSFGEKERKKERRSRIDFGDEKNVSGQGTLKGNRKQKLGWLYIVPAGTMSPRKWSVPLIRVKNETPMTIKHMIKLGNG